MSPHRLRIVLSPLASDDLDDILLYSKLNWGSRHRDSYHRSLLAGLRRVASHPRIGRERPEYGVGVRSYRIQNHIAIYLVTESEIWIALILHFRRDIDAEMGL